MNGYAKGVSAGGQNTEAELAYRQRLVRYAEHHDVIVLEGTTARARIRGDVVVLEELRATERDRRC